MRLLPFIRNTVLSLSSSLRNDVVDMTTLSHVVPPLPQGHRRLVLVRHGETNWNARGLMQGGGFDIDLNEDGHEQAQQARAHLVCQDFGVVASSHLERASSTADAIGSEHPGAVRIISQGLGEMRFGDFEGTAIRGPDSCPDHQSKFQAIADAMKQDKSMPWPRGESIQDVQRRSRKAIDAMLRDFDASNLLVVGHGRTNKILMSSLLQVEEGELPLQSNACINVLDVDKEGRWKPQLINYTGHLFEDSVFL